MEKRFFQSTGFIMTCVKRDSDVELGTVGQVDSHNYEFCRDASARSAQFKRFSNLKVQPSNEYGDSYLVYQCVTKKPVPLTLSLLLFENLNDSNSFQINLVDKNDFILFIKNPELESLERLDEEIEVDSCIVGKRLVCDAYILYSAALDHSFARFKLPSIIPEPTPDVLFKCLASPYYYNTVNFTRCGMSSTLHALQYVVGIQPFYWCKKKRQYRQLARFSYFRRRPQF
jgi:hypothetical protein